MLAWYKCIDYIRSEDRWDMAQSIDLVINPTKSKLKELVEKMFVDCKLKRDYALSQVATLKDKSGFDYNEVNL